MQQLPRKAFTTLIALGLLMVAAIGPARCESIQALIFYRYIKDLYFATKLVTVANYWADYNRKPWKELTGTRAAQELARIKMGYVYKPRIIHEVADGKYYKMKGTAIASDHGRQIPCTVDVIMIQEEGIWKIMSYTWRAEVMRNQSF
jgi:hypothetical protein